MNTLPSRLRRLLPAVLLTLALALAGCQGSTDQPTGAATPGASGGSAGAEPTGTVTVLAAASLTESFTAIGKAFEQQHPGVTVTFSFGSSATLATQITQGAPADVFAAANETTMDTVDSAGLAVGRKDFVSNVLQIAVPRGNPAKITGLADFADAGKTTVLCAEQVPCGSAAKKVFELAKITPTPKSYETDVKAALAKVTPTGSGSAAEADAALVYRTDVIAAGDAVEGIDFPESAKAVNTYPIATVKGGPNAAAAAAFVAYVLSPEGQKVLTDAGFGAP